MAPNRIGRADGMSDLYLRLQTWLDDALNFWSDNGSTGCTSLPP
jgi:hypothetical protein